MTKEKFFLPTYTLGEELCNAISHGIGTCLAIAACVLCIVRAAIHGDAWCVVSGSIYGATLIILYCMSTLYHSITNKTAKRVFRVFDHTCIYLLIAGSYTPFTLVSIRSALGWVIFGIVWGVAILGIVLNAINIEKFKIFSMISYITMGWAVLLGIVPLIKAMHPAGFTLLAIGGVCYTVGIIFYALKKLKYMHSIWHVFVLAGSIFQFFAIYLYVLPLNLL